MHRADNKLVVDGPDGAADWEITIYGLADEGLGKISISINGAVMVI